MYQCHLMSHYMYEGKFSGTSITIINELLSWSITCAGIDTRKQRDRNNIISWKKLNHYKKANSCKTRVSKKNSKLVDARCTLCMKSWKQTPNYVVPIYLSYIKGIHIPSAITLHKYVLHFFSYNNIFKTIVVIFLLLISSPFRWARRFLFQERVSVKEPLSTEDTRVGEHMMYR